MNNYSKLRRGLDKWMSIDRPGNDAKGLAIVAAVPQCTNAVSVRRNVNPPRGYRSLIAPLDNDRRRSIEAQRRGGVAGDYWRAVEEWDVWLASRGVGLER